MNALAVAIVTHRNAATIEACLAALLEAPEVTYVRVVDNASDDGTVPLVSRAASKDPRVHFIANEDNRGFGAGINQAVSDLPRDFCGQLLVLNPDCEMAAAQIRRMGAHAAHEPDALLGTDLVDGAGIFDPNARRNDLLFWPALLRLAGRGDYRFHVPRREGETLQAVPAISGAVMWMPLTLFRALKGFDEGYRLHAEDLDFCLRARRHGAKVFCANDVVVRHLRSVSSRTRPFFVEWNKHLGLIRYFRRYEAVHLNGLQRSLVSLAIWLRLPLSLLRAVINR